MKRKNIYQVYSKILFSSLYINALFWGYLIATEDRILQLFLKTYQTVCQTWKNVMFTHFSCSIISLMVGTTEGKCQGHKTVHTHHFQHLHDRQAQSKTLKFQQAGSSSKQDTITYSYFIRDFTAR
jgi:hypothetical protein